MTQPPKPVMLLQNVGDGRRLCIMCVPDKISVSIMRKEAMEAISLFNADAYGGPLFFVNCTERELAANMLAGWQRLRCDRLVSRQVYVRVRELICWSFQSNLGKRAVRHQLTRASSAAMAKVMEKKWVEGK